MSEEVYEYPKLIIMAAGLGQRFGGGKTLSAVGPYGESLLEYAVYDAWKAGFKSIIFIIREEMLAEIQHKVTAKLPEALHIDFVFQSIAPCPDQSVQRSKPWGTGHALLQASPKVQGTFCVVNADDYYGAKTLYQAYEYLKYSAPQLPAFAMMGFPVVNTLSENGGVNRGLCKVDKNARLTAIEEISGLQKANSIIQGMTHSNEPITLRDDSLVSMNCWLLDYRIFPVLKTMWEAFIQSPQNWSNSEFMLPDVIDYLIKEKQQEVKLLPTSEQWFGLTFAEDIAICSNYLKDKIRDKKYPAPLFIKKQ